MNVPPNGAASLRAALTKPSESAGRYLWGRQAGVCLQHLAARTAFTSGLAALAGRSVLLASRDPLATATSLIELDGIARRLIICTPDLQPQHLEDVAARAGADAIVCADESCCVPRVAIRSACDVRSLTPVDLPPVHHSRTEWVLLTSGTTGAPKLVVHTLDSLSAPIAATRASGRPTVWGTFYDIRRYGGLQVLLRALLDNGSLVLSDPGEAAGDYLARLVAAGATHVTGTPSHWRRALMCLNASTLAPLYVRLSGEIVDQSILNALRSAFPAARISHAFASTEAGVGFEVNDGLEGFPENVVARSHEVDIRILDGTIRIRSPRRATGYLDEPSPLAGDDGFVDTGDVVERRGSRFYFLGRRSGVINVGGQKVYPEEVEAAINRHPAVRMSLVSPRANPILGSLVSADVVLDADAVNGVTPAEMRQQIVQICQARLTRHKVPATIRFVSTVDLAPAGKLARHA